MQIFIDLMPRSEGFFISIYLSETQSLSFDYTLKGHRIIKQVLLEDPSGKLPNQGPLPSRKVLKSVDGKFSGFLERSWADRVREGSITDGVWRTVWESYLPEPIIKKLQELSEQVFERSESGQFDRTLDELDKYLLRAIAVESSDEPAEYKIA